MKRKGKSAIIECTLLQLKTDKKNLVSDMFNNGNLAIS